ncbi:serine/threonine protein phosphatase 1 [Ekhidna lutea]|uniref:Serine/threonine protein phosphatase 1 n=1 Tax=Ekhidna lutea TaxID=447679 RepID=A0A239MDM0_EKHLU|nr:metallophosphoesterase [Ekhidna lutea]SNT39929.1 serine/threonine protein phosphatase 1 [Ekhidna lutea]
MARTLVMGDIHGNLKALEQCLERCSFDLENDKLIQLGDVCDRHPDSALVVEKLIKISKLVAIRGNHDPWLKKWLRSEEVNPAWPDNGGISTIQSYIQAGDKIDRSKHLTFLEEQVDFHVDEENRVFIHAGFTNPKGPSFEQPSSNCYWDRSLWLKSMEARTTGRQPDFLNAFKEIYIGHTPTIKWLQDTPMQAFNVWNLDTGAGWHGKLTVMDIDTKEYWQSDASGLLY